MRRQPNSTSASGIIKDKHRPPSPDALRLRGGLTLEPGQALDIVDDFPDIVPVTESELETIETYFGNLLDELLKRKP
jgi:hypothetical protein